MEAPEIPKTNSNFTLFPLFGYMIGKSTYNIMKADPNAKIVEDSSNNNTSCAYVPKVS